MLLCAKGVCALQVTEIMYNPKGEDSRYEFVELYNETASRRDVSGWAFVQGIEFVFPQRTVIEPRSYFVVVRHAETVKKKYRIKNVFGPFQGALDNRKERLVLVDLAGGIMVDVTYNSRGRWPVAPDGTGHSLSKISPRLNPNHPQNWRASREMGGTPGKENGLEDVYRKSYPIVFNEVFVPQDQQKPSALRRGNRSGFIELYNRSSEPFDLSGYWLSNHPSDLKGYKIPARTLLSSHGHKHFQHLGFTLNAQGDRLFITTPDGKRVVQACRLGTTAFKKEVRKSFGRYPDGADEWYVMKLSLGKTNFVELETDILINELMYHPSTDSDDDEYIEIFNLGKEDVDLSGWSISGGISFDFPDGTIVSNAGYLVIAKAQNHLTAKYHLKPELVLGDFKRRLSDEEDPIRLRDNFGNKVDEVHYYDGGHWSKSADGYGSSLELIDPRQDNSNHQAWAPSNEARKAEWIHVSYSGRTGSRWGGHQSNDEFHLHLLGAGEMLIDDIQITAAKESLLARLSPSSRTHIENGSFEKGLKGWRVMGNHTQSRVVDEASQHGKKCLKLVATGRGDTGANHIEIPLTSSLKNGVTYTISFWAKWLRGNNLLVTRFWNNRIPETHHIPIPKLTGTPGRQNSVYQSNLGPVFRDVRHSPIIPTPVDSVHITAHVSDPDGIRSVTLYYKGDSDKSYAKTRMYDDGKHADAAAKDGIFGGEIPPRQANQTVAFYIEANDSSGGHNTWPRHLSPPGLYRVEQRRQQSDSDFPTYRIIMTSEDTWELEGRPVLSNEPLNSTFIFNETDVYYQVKCRYIGSPFGRVRGYKIRFNADEKLHGVKLQARFDRNDFSYKERIAYDLQRKMRLPTCQQEWVRVLFNGSTYGTWEDILPPSKRYLSIFYPDDSDGQLFEVDDRFVFYRGGHFENMDATFEWLDTDDKDMYRWNYEPRNHARADDFTHLIQMINVMNNTPKGQYEDAISQVINVDQWLRVMAVRTIIGDWDFFGGSRGKNAYLYRPNKTGKWEILSWDSELTFNQSNMSIWSGFRPIQRFQMSPKHQHLYYSYIREVLDEYFNVSYLSPWLEHYASIIRNPWPGEMKSFIIARTNHLNRVIPKADPQITRGKRTRNGIDLEGTAPVQVRFVSISGVEYQPNWMGATHWKLTIPSAKQKKLTVLFLDYDKQTIGQDAIRLR
ncbi:lamin tail domain-containing protein [Candidatus Poribacteria bacterium]|nr:lamin tail domain-containing protein [Candidatus Poribacteria bacterium]